MDYIPDYSDKNFIGSRSIFASILYFILACFNYIMAGVYYYIIYKLYWLPRLAKILWKF